MFKIHILHKLFLLLFIHISLCTVFVLTLREGSKVNEPEALEPKLREINHTNIKAVSLSIQYHQAAKRPNTLGAYKRPQTLTQTKSTGSLTPSI